MIEHILEIDKMVLNALYQGKVRYEKVEGEWVNEEGEAE